MEEAGDVDGEMDEPESSVRIADGSTTRSLTPTSTSSLGPAQHKGEPESSIRIADGSAIRTSASTSTSGLNPAQNKVTYHQIDRWSAVSP